MKRIRIFVVLCFMLFSCFTMTAFATAGSTDVYIGVTTISKSNMKFLIVDEADIPIEGATIDVWTNDKLAYQLLGVSHDGGIYESKFPYGNYPYRVYKEGYEKVEQTLNLPNKTDPHIEKVVLKKEKKADIEPIKPVPNDNVDTGDTSKTLAYVALFTMSSLFIVLICFRRSKKQNK